MTNLGALSRLTEPLLAPAPLFCWSLRCCEEGRRSGWCGACEGGREWQPAGKEDEDLRAEDDEAAKVEEGALESGPQNDGSRIVVLPSRSVSTVSSLW